MASAFIVAQKKVFDNAAFPLQALPEGLTPYYLEIEEISGMNFGGGNAQLDLESGVFDWACG